MDPHKGQIRNLKLVKFRPLSHSQFLQNPDIFQLLEYQNQTIQIEHNQPTWMFLLPLIKQSIAKRFKIEVYTSSPQIIELIVMCQFSKLTTLSLTKNDLLSIEGLVFLDIPQLQKLCLDNNNLIQERSLYKTNWPRLSRLSLFNNKILQLDLSRLKLKRQHDTKVMRTRYLVPQLKDISYILKMQPVNVFQIEVLGRLENKMEGQQRIHKKINEKYAQGKFYL